MSTALDTAQITEALGRLPGWSHDAQAPALVLEQQAPTFPEAIAWVGRVAEAAEELNHHPDIDIRWRTVTFRCATHSEGAVTAADVDLAGRISALAPS